MSNATKQLLRYLAPALAGFVIAIALFGSRAKERERVMERVSVRTRVDTVREVVRVQMRPIKMSGRSSHSEFMKSECSAHPPAAITMHAEAPTFMKNKCCATLDTLISGDTAAFWPDTLRVAYRLDSDRFDVRVGLSARRVTVAVPVLLHDTTIERSIWQSSERHRPWYEETLMLLGAAAVGYLLH